MSQPRWPHLTESNWRKSNDVRIMLVWMRDKASPRKFLLFAAACCRHAWPLLVDERTRTAVEVAERFADGLATRKELDDSAEGARAAARFALEQANQTMTSARTQGHVSRDTSPEWSAAVRLSYAADTGRFWSLRRYSELADMIAATIRQATGDVATHATFHVEPAQNPERAVHADYWRDLIGDPFGTPSLDPEVRTWDSGTVVNLARGIYDERHLPEGMLDGERMSILADALEEAGCSEDAILDHLRKPGPHVRGCWVVDLILGKT